MTSAAANILIRVGGMLHVCIFTANALVPGTLDWRGELAKLHVFLRRLVWVYGAFIVMTIAAFAAGSLLMSGALAGDTPLARAVCGFIGLFWFARLLVAVFVLDARPFLTNGWYRAGYAALTMTFVYLAAAYGAVAICTRA